MIATDRMKAAFAATPLCQMAWTKTGDEGGATKLCAISALVSFAGVQPELIAKMAKAEMENAFVCHTQTGPAYVPRWVADLALPVLRVEYGIPREVGVLFPLIFDKQENEWRGVQEVLALCERLNMGEWHAEAIHEDAARFPQYGPAAPPAVALSNFSSVLSLSVAPFLGIGNGYFGTATQPMQVTAEVVKQKPGKSKFWTAPTMPVIAKYHTGGLAVL